MVEQTDDRLLAESAGALPDPGAASVMVCPACGFENLMGADACGNCGSDLMTSDIPMAATEFERLLTQVPLGALAPRPSLTVKADAAVADVLRIMRDDRAAGVVVTDADGKVVGIFTERDAVLKLAGHDLPAGPISEFMTNDPVVLRADDSLAVAIQKMAVGGFRHIPIVAGGRPVGIVTSHDVFRHVLRLVD
ncbi:MAG: CBS domain-containing protein [Chloroflexi bacterium]|nr:CBS domain-containing protein [Chloroflexota bacterium]